MALRFALFAAALLLWASCAGTGAGPSGAGPSGARPSGAGPSGAGIDRHASARARGQHSRARSVLVVMPATDQTEVVWTVLHDELGSEFDVQSLRIDRETPTETLVFAIEHFKPSCFVLIGNSSVRLYYRYQRLQPAGARFPLSVIVMTALLEQSYGAIQNATGIAYEVPGVIQFVKLRTIIERPVQKVGVVYRSPFAGFVERQSRLAKREEVDLVGIPVGREPARDDVANALRSLVDREHVDALWVLNDNVLLTSSLITSVWLPFIESRHRIPVVVGVESLLSQNVPIGSFAMLPDHTALGVQTANLISDLADEEWDLQGRGIQLPHSIRTVIHLPRVRRDFGLREGALEKVDQIVQ